ncbi:type 1 glutamine amidotransferase domain-containing protein [Corynebacterium sp. H113]|uniref:type 1 glutamine amidotransferase domain-containing protein n=1 Tax=Corynebacterium sp. H113 TaxID=3133419 RepID=UPI00309A8113
MTTILMALSAADSWTLKDGSKHPTGFWAEEFVVPYDTFVDAGFDVEVATPGGKRPVVDRLSLSMKGGVFPDAAKKLEERLRELDIVLANPKDLHQVSADDYDLIFFPGGHGPMEDLSDDATVGTMLNKRLASGKLLALLCHAPAALLATSTDSERSPFAGRRVTALSNVEERINPFSWKAKWLLQDKLEEAGLDYSMSFPFRPHIVQDDNLFTGQNPQSSEKLAKALVKKLV